MMSVLRRIFAMRGGRGLARSRCPELFEAGDLVNCHRGAGLAELAPLAEPRETSVRGTRTGTGAGSATTARRSCRRMDPREPCYQVGSPLRFRLAS